MSGRLLILSGPSGVGKDTVIDLWKTQDARVERVVAYTTREPRAGEREGVDYHFVSAEEFHRKQLAGDFLESKEVHGAFYATPLNDMEALLRAGKVAILKIDVQGAMTALELRPDALAVFLLPPSEAELERRIRGRGTEAEAVILKRLTGARAEMALSDRYHYQVVNDTPENVVSFLRGLIDG